MQLVIDTPAVKIMRKSHAFYLENGEGIHRSISPEKITSIAILTSDCTLRADAVNLAAEKNIPIMFAAASGSIKAVLRSPHFTALADLRRRQSLFLGQHEAILWLIEGFEMKI